MMKKKYKIDKKFIGSVVSVWIKGYPNEIVLDKDTKEKDIKRLLALQHPAIVEDDEK